MIPVVYENDTFIIVNKPAGLNFHSEDGEPGLVVLLQQQLDVEQLYPVHRLDKMTSGLLILAKNKQAAQRFQEMFSEREVTKFYIAIADKKPKKKQGLIKGDMQAARNGSWKLAKSNANPAITQFISISLQPNERLFLLKPKTGKTHQLRVAMKSLSAPICGDERYAAKEQATKEDRGYLHAYALRFMLDGSVYEFICLPDSGKRFLSTECQKQLKAWQQPWDLIK